VEGAEEGRLYVDDLFSGLAERVVLPDVFELVPEYEGLLCVAVELGLEYTGLSWGAVD